MKKLLLLSLLPLSAAYMSAATPVEATSLDVTQLEVVAKPSPEFSVKAVSAAVEGTMYEDIISTGFGAQPSTFTVQVQKDFDTETYIINDPWRAFYDQIGGTGQVSPSMEVIATDPTCAVVVPTEIGINGGETDGAYSVLSYSYYAMAQGQDCPEDYKITVTEEGENTVITFPIYSMLIAAETSGKLYYGSLGVTTITFPTITEDGSGIVDINADNNAEVEYFNLQGIRVENPAAGQILIKRQGTKVSKVFVR